MDQYVPSSSKISESEIQYLLEIHPYLISERFEKVEFEPQKKLESGRADLVFYLEDEIFVVELKVVPLDFEATLQLNGYLEDIKLLFPDKFVSGILIGKKPKDDILSLINTLEFQIEIKIINEEIPLSIKICKACRKANSKKQKVCIYCDCTEWIN